MKTKSCHRALFISGALLALACLDGCAIIGGLGNVISRSDNKEQAGKNMNNGTASSTLRLVGGQNAQRQTDAIDSFNRARDYKQQAGSGSPQ